MKKQRKYEKNRVNGKSTKPFKISVFPVACAIAVVLAFYALCLVGKGGGDHRNSVASRKKSTENDSKAGFDSSSVQSPFLKQPFSTDTDKRTGATPQVGRFVNVATMNLLCAKGLPGAEDLDIDECLKTLEQWARHVDLETQRYMTSFTQNPQRFYNSLAYYKVLIMMTVLKEDMGIKYNPDLIRPNQTYEDFQKNYTKDSRDAFIHGLLTGKRQGTCASMPVLVVSIGELLEYPLRLAACKGHMFVRWDDGVEVFNFDVTGGGVQLKADEYYRKWPWPLTSRDLEKGFFMKSLSRNEMHAAFLITRAAIIRSNGDVRGADQVAFSATKVAPNAPVWEDQTWVELNRSAMAMGLAKSRDPEIERKIEQQRAVWERRLLGLTGVERQNELRNINMQLNVMRDTMETDE